MRAIVLTGLIAAFLAGCSAGGRNNYVTAEGYERMSREQTPVARHDAARTACTEAGLADGTRRFARCVANYLTLDAAMLRARAQELRDRAARRHGICIAPYTLAVMRCIEI